MTVFVELYKGWYVTFDLAIVTCFVTCLGIFGV